MSDGAEEFEMSGPPPESQHREADKDQEDAINPHAFECVQRS
jgi:hypothetical protein